MGENATEVKSLDEIIPFFSDGETNANLIYGRVLDKVYYWFRINSPGFTEEDVVNAVMRKYVGVESGKREQVKRSVHCGMSSGRHLWVNPFNVEHPCVEKCRQSASAAGIEEASQAFRVLIYVAFKGWADNIATVTALEIVKALDLRGSEQGRKMSVRRSLKRLENLGLLRRTQVGFQGCCSVYEILFGLRPGVPVPADPDATLEQEMREWDWVQMGAND